MYEVKWHLNTEFPDEPGYYLITEQDSYCGSLVWQTNAAFWTGEYWDYDGVLAWAEVPVPFMTWDDEVRNAIFEQDYKNSKIRNQRILMYQTEANLNALPF